MNPIYHYLIAVFSLSLLLNCGGSSTLSWENEILQPGNHAFYSSVSAEELQTIEAFINLMNLHRLSVGCESLIWDDNAAFSAQLHSLDMQENNFFDHQNLDGDMPWQRLADQSVSFGLAGENIADAPMQAQTVLNAWLNSPGHRANIENCQFTHHGVGMYAPRMWTHVFYTP